MAAVPLETKPLSKRPRMAALYIILFGCAWPLQFITLYITIGVCTSLMGVSYLLPRGFFEYLAMPASAIPPSILVILAAEKLRRLLHPGFIWIQVLQPSLALGYLCGGFDPRTPWLLWIASGYFPILYRLSRRAIGRKRLNESQGDSKGNGE